MGNSRSSRRRRAFEVLGRTATVSGGNPWGGNCATTEEPSVELDDRFEAHLHAVIGMKLRTGKASPSPGKTPSGEDDKRNVIWIDSGVPVPFKSDGSKMHQTHGECAETLAVPANTNDGLVNTQETITTDQPAHTSTPLRQPGDK